MASMQRLELEAKTNVANSDPLANTMKLFSQFGIPPEEIFPRVFGFGGKDKDGEDDEDKAPGWAAALPAAMGMVGELAKAMATRGGQPQMAPRPQYVAQQAPPPPPQRQAVPFVAPQQAAQRPSRPRAIPAPPVEVAPSQQRAPVAVPVESFEDPEAAPEGSVIRMVPPSSMEEPAPPSAPAASLSDIAAAAGLNLKAQKAARTGLRSLIKKVGAAEEEKWEELIGAAVMQEPNIFHYIKAVTVKAAMIENGADEALAARVMAAMRASAIVPEDLPYGDGGEA
jgi:hypothetical protein